MILAMVAAAAACWGQTALPLEGDTADGWIARPSYLGNPGEGPSVQSREGAITFTVAEPDRGMKWELHVTPFSALDPGLLVVRYRAENLGRGGYTLWAYDGSQGGLPILSPPQLTVDGEWHEVALDLWALNVSGAVRGLVVEVQCAGPEPAVLSIDYLRLTDTPPEGAITLPEQPVDAAEWRIDFDEPMDCQPQPDWLGNAADEHAVEVEDGRLHLRVSGAGKGMKWRVDLDDAPDLSPYRYATVRYRAENTAPHGDYLVWLGSETGGQPLQYAGPFHGTDVEPDGAWHVLTAPLEAKFRPVELAVQCQSAAAQADLWLDYLLLTSRRPLLPLEDAYPFEIGWDGARLKAGEFECVDFSAECDAAGASRARSLGLSSWFPAREVAVGGIPFRLMEGPNDLLVVGGRARREVSLGDVRPTEAYLLLAVRLPTLDFSGMLRGRPFRQTSQPERLVAAVTYADGVTDEIFPVEVPAHAWRVRNGIGCYCLPELRDEPLRSLALENRTTTGSLALAAVTLHRGKARTPAPPVLSVPLRPTIQWQPPEARREARVEGGRLTVESVGLRLELNVRDGIRLEGLGLHGVGSTPVRPGPLFEIGVGETVVGSDQLGTGPVKQDGRRVEIPFDARGKGVPLAGRLIVDAGVPGRVRMELDVRNASEKPITPIVNFPVLRGARLGSVEDTWYLFAQKGGVINNKPCNLRAAYGGQHPLQVGDLFSPSAGAGLALLTEDLENSYKFWHLEKTDAGVNWSIEYFPREYQPGEKIEVAPTALAAHAGDWRDALRIYGEWVSTWYTPQVPRQKWFQGCFNYRQHLVWGDLRDQKTGRYRFEEIIAADREFFGHLDYLHIFDFGQSRKYGRVGDYSHYDEIGGREALAGAIAAARADDVPIGLYIEGYLCDERGVWGSENVSKYDIRKADGSPLLWTGAEKEHMMCPAAEGWQDYLAATYKRVAGELKPSGMYIDQHGFTDQWKICHSGEHGHPVPWAPLRGEEQMGRKIRAAVPPGIATLTEETPCDFTSQFQDGALGYSVASTNPELAPHRVDLFRFMFPDFKVFQLVAYNNFVEGGWHRLKFPFFNGEGYWLGNGIPAGFEPAAQEFLRRAFELLNEYEEAFTSPDVEPLAPTLAPLVYANRFSGKSVTVWTLFNADYRTFRGPVLAAAHEAGATYRDGFSGEEVTPQVKDNQATLSAELGPREVGCLIQRQR